MLIVEDGEGRLALKRLHVTSKQTRSKVRRPGLDTNYLGPIFSSQRQATHLSTGCMSLQHCLSGEKGRLLQLYVLHLLVPFFTLVVVVFCTGVVGWMMGHRVWLLGRMLMLLLWSWLLL